MPVGGTNVIGTHRSPKGNLQALFVGSRKRGRAASSQLGHYLEPGRDQPKLVRIVRGCVDPVLLSVKYKRVKTVEN